MQGTPFGRYRLMSQLGRGGMGEVWRAFDTATERVVALKVLSAHLAHDETFQQRFRGEARAAAGLNEPHVVPIHDFGEIDGQLYVNMRLIEGSDLQVVLAEGPLEPDRAVRIVEQIGSALHAAHEIGLVHRDVKPSNILLAAGDFSYLIDFGIARAAGEVGLTSTGTTVGTWAYMAPERFRAGAADAGAADARVDVYALTCVLYQCLTGHQPFPGEGFEQVAAGHMFLPPPRPSDVRPGLPAQMDDVIAIGMDKEPGNRFPTTTALAEAARMALSADAAATATVLAEPPTAVADVPVRSGTTRPFAQYWPNPEDSGFTPYRQHVEIAAAPTATSGFGGGRLILTIAAGAILVAATIIGGIWLAIGGTRTDAAEPRNINAAAGPTPAAPPTAPIPTALNGLPGTDDRGFIGFPDARCDPANTPAVMARTTESVVVVCQAGPGNYYYRAVRISDGASIELANAVRSSDGFDVSNPADGTLRQVRRTAVLIIQPDGRVSSEPVVEFAGS